MALAAILFLSATTAKAQIAADSMDVSFTSIKADSVADNALSPIKADSVYKVKRDWSTWRPNPKRAMWLAIVLPGAGQIYNRNQMYTDYSQAYLDLMDDDPNTQSYNQFLHLGAKIDESNIQRYQTLFKKRKDKFRRWRDLSFFCLVGVYALSIVDAYVDASLSEFDISKDLSLKLEPTIINDNRQRNPFKANSLGLSCSLNF